MNFGIHIPVHELPERLNEIAGYLDAGKTIVTACPHKDRAIVARMYLMTVFKDVDPSRLRYYKDGFVSMVEHLRGDTAKNFVWDIGL
jgi:hypothetical protein